MKFSVIIPARNEEENIFRVVNQIRPTSDRRETEIIVVDGRSSDRTLEVARNFADKAIAARPCRAVQMQEGALAASGDILLFLHADTELPANWQEALGRAWRAEPRPSAVAFSLSFDKTSLRYRAIEELARLRTRFSQVPQGDQAISVEKERYFSVGGYPDVPLMEEYYLLRKLRRYGPVRVLPEAVKTSARRYEANGPLRNALRNTALVSLFYLGVSPRSLARWYR